MIGIYPKTDSSHGYGNPSTYSLIQFHMRCIGISRKIPSTVTVPLLCGQWLFVSYTLAMHFTVTSFLGIGIKPLLAKMERSKESE
jgi:hypothetical protein